MTRLLGRPITVALTALTLLAAGCSSEPGEPTPVAATSTLSQALTLVPGTVTDVTFMDLAAAKARWGLSAVNGTTGTDDPQRAALNLKVQAAAAGSPLDTNGALLRELGWDNTDVDWSASWAAGGPPVTIYRLRDGLDMAVVVDALAKDGMTRSGTDDAIRFEPISPGEGAFGRVFLSGVTVIASRHLLVAGPAAAATLPDSASSLAANGTAAALTSALPAVDYVQLAVGAAACADPVATLGARASPEQIAMLREQQAKTAVKNVTGTVVAVTDDTHAVVRTAYPDEATAAADLPARKQLLSGYSLVTRAPYADYFAAAVAVDGSTLRYDLDLQGPAGRVRSIVDQRDTPWSFC